MTDDLLQSDLFTFESDASLDELTAILEGAERVYLKKLSLNDWQWSENSSAHQGGVYIPHQDRDSGFFPALSLKERAASGAPIREIWFDLHWPQAETTKTARLVHYTSKGQETHLTNVVKEPFRGVSPASFLVIARRRLDSGELQFTAFVADSGGLGVGYLHDLFRFDSNFISGCFVPEAAARESADRAFSYVEQAVRAWREGSLIEFAAAHAMIPSTSRMAELAQAEYMNTNSLSSLNPFTLAAPGDALMRISRDIEYRLFKDFELRARSVELIRIVFGTDSAAVTAEGAIRSLITEFPRIDKVLLSAAQQRKSRAGKSFELHIERLLKDGGVPYEAQVVIESKKRPDFVLPDFLLYSDSARTRQEALVLSAKTTLRERWKQVHSEIQNCDLYLATVDENVAATVISEMAEAGICLVVPESLKTSDAAVYRRQANVISFAEFFETHIRKHRFPLWRARYPKPLK
ncbi:type II restriction endonuclease [Variovorax sp. 375MFSha3.1]|uniref:type II restriction endonuclease n=1 Tax=Variovorax sp. 375MFSha3.1 TaxID=3158364 RepID=UPI003AAB83CE